MPGDQYQIKADTRQVGSAALGYSQPGRFAQAAPGAVTHHGVANLATGGEAETHRLIGAGAQGLRH